MLELVEEEAVGKLVAPSAKLSAALRSCEGKLFRRTIGDSNFTEFVCKRNRRNK